MFVWRSGIILLKANGLVPLGWEVARDQAARGIVRARLREEQADRAGVEGLVEAS